MSFLKKIFGKDKKKEQKVKLRGGRDDSENQSKHVQFRRSVHMGDRTYGEEDMSDYCRSVGTRNPKGAQSYAGENDDYETRGQKYVVRQSMRSTRRITAVHRRHSITTTDDDNELYGFMIRDILRNKSNKQGGVTYRDKYKYMEKAFKEEKHKNSLIADQLLSQKQEMERRFELLEMKLALQAQQLTPNYQPQFMLPYDYNAMHGNFQQQMHQQRTSTPVYKRPETLIDFGSPSFTLRTPLVGNVANLACDGAPEQLASRSSSPPSEMGTIGHFPVTNRNPDTLSDQHDSTLRADRLAAGAGETAENTFVVTPRTSRIAPAMPDTPSTDQGYTTPPPSEIECCTYCDAAICECHKMEAPIKEKEETV